VAEEHISAFESAPEDVSPRDQSAELHHDAKLAIDQFSIWVRNADTKAALLTTAVTILGGALAGRASVAATRLPPDSIRDWLAVSAYGTSIGLAVVAAVLLVTVLRPRRVVKSFTRFSWPTVAELTEAELLAAVARPGAKREAWLTAHALAQIAAFKLRVISWALALSTLSAFLFFSALALL
jgi:hypothetical protein